MLKVLTRQCTDTHEADENPPSTQTANGREKANPVITWDLMPNVQYTGVGESRVRASMSQSTKKGVL